MRMLLYILKQKRLAPHQLAPRSSWRKATTGARGASYPPPLPHICTVLLLARDRADFVMNLNRNFSVSYP